jgi:hypothetical protein
VAVGSAEARARLALLAEELKRGRIVEARLVEPGYHVHGLCDRETDAIIIDPAPATVSTLLHELLHRRFPRWGERRVAAEERRLMRYLSDDEIRWWYGQYLRRRRRQRRPVAVRHSEEG